MKKHFLLLFLMALLPLAGWAGDITVTMGTINKFYGDADPYITVNDFSIVLESGDVWGGDGTPTKAALLPYLTYKRVTQGESVNGTYYFTLVKSANLATEKPNWNVVISGQGVVNIFPKDISDEDAVTATGPVGQTFNVGDWTQPSFILKNAANNEELTATDFESVVYTTAGDDAITGKGNGNKVTITGQGNYTGTRVLTFDIAAKALTADGIIAQFTATPDLTFNGSAQDVPAFTVTDGDAILVATTDYTVTDPADVTNAGEKTITINGAGNYSGSVELNYEIAKKSLADEDVTAAVISAQRNKTYKGSAYTFVPANLSVKFGDIALTSASYDRSYAHNVNVGSMDDADETKRPTVIITGKGNYKDQTKAYFNIAPRDLSDAGVTISDDLVADQAYKGIQIKPSTEGKITFTTPDPDYTLVENTDYTVTYGNNINVADGGTITIQGIGNFGGDAIVKNFNITKVALNVNAKDFTKNVGNADPTSDALADGGYYELTGFVNEETAETAGVTGAPTFAITAHTEAAGTKDDVITIATVGTLAAANYSFAVGAAADLIINQAGVTITVTSEEQTYGYKLPTLDKDAFAFTATGLMGAEEITALTYTVKKGDDTFVAGDMLVAGEYEIIASDATATSDSYVFNYVAGTLTVNPLVVEFIAVDQEINYGSDPALAKNGTWQTVPNATWNNNRLELWYGPDAENLTKATDMTFFNTYNVWKQDFVEELTWNVAPNKPVAEPGTIEITEKEGYDNANFNVTFTKGNVTYKAGTIPTEVTFNGDANDLTKINTYAGQEMTVKMNFATRNARTLGTAREWKAGYWHTMVLPFDISVADLSKTLGYAIVNVIDPSKTVVSGTGSEFYGKLTMKGGYDNEEKIPANKPFILKLAYDIDPTKDYNFGQQTIVAPANEADRTVDAGGDCSFVGTYETKNVTSADKAAYWFMLGNYEKWAYIMESSTNIWDIIPFEAYIDMSNLPAGARNMTFYVEDIDGTITAIKSINVDDMNQKLSPEGWYNLNGVKLQGAPTEKGVYIKDGKKFVIK